MIIKEYYGTRQDGVKLYKTYSDEGKYILQTDTGIIYAEAIDIENAPHEYDETQEVIESVHDKRDVETERDY